MGSDIQFYSNLHEEMQSGAAFLPEIISPGNDVILHFSYTVPRRGTYILEFNFNALLRLEINGCLWSSDEFPQYAEGLCSSKITLEEGLNHLSFRLLNSGEQDVKPFFEARILDEEWNIVRQPHCSPLPETPIREEPSSRPDLKAFHPGTGAAYKSCGRFGYTKGDGVLDCSMPAFGIVARPFICGHPQYRRSNLWHFSLLPENEQESSSLNSSYRPAPGEKIQNDWTHVRWQRPLPEGRFLSFDYSLLTPALLIETDLDTIRLSRLSGIGGFQSVSLPLADGVLTRNISGTAVYNQSSDGILTQNWIMLSRSGVFPEVPILLILRTSPREIQAEYSAQGRLDVLTLQFDDPVEWCFLEMPYGIRLFHPEDLSREWYDSAVQLCRRRQLAALARPCACRDFFRRENNQMHIIQEFDFRCFTDSLETESCRIAPLPPPLITAAEEIKEIHLDSRTEDLDFPTKYGPLHGVRNSSWSEYTVPLACPRCSIPFSSPQADAYGKLLHEDFDDFLSYHQDAPEIINPGCYSFIFQYALTARLFPFLLPEDRKKLDQAIRTGLQQACDPDYQYNGPGGRQCFSWYLRKEPFSGVEYYITYLHVSGIRRFRNCDKETIQGYPGTFIENDWGNAMALYGIWLGALMTDSWDFISSRWSVLRKAFDYYLVMMDWACMTTGYCENGVSWNDGTNFGAYPAFMNMAEMTGHEEDFNLAQYAYAKMTAMRLGLLFTSQKYLHRFFEVQPWYISKFFHEETDCSCAFTSYPRDIVYNHYRCESLYNMTTEGHYTEAWKFYQQYSPREISVLLDVFEKAMPYSPVGARPENIPSLYHTVDNHIGWQECLTYLSLCILSRRYPAEKLKQMIEQASAEDRISREFLGHLTWSRRRVPKAWARITLLSMLENRDSVQLTAWQGLNISSASSHGIQVEVHSRQAWLEITAPTRPHIYFNGVEQQMTKTASGLYRIPVTASGLLECRLTRP